VTELVDTQDYCAAREGFRLCIGPDFINMLPFIVDQFSPGLSSETTFATVIVV
jgi:hypothetical protein